MLSSYLFIVIFLLLSFQFILFVLLQIPVSPRCRTTFYPIGSHRRFRFRVARQVSPTQVCSSYRADAEMKSRNLEILSTRLIFKEDRRKRDRIGPVSPHYRAF